jgi:outer membrane protein OmpA-like peptidoglycan-associated protein
MMVMFVLFAVLVAVLMQEKREIIEAAERQQPVPVSVPTPTLIPDPTPTRLPVPSFEPLMRVNVFERSQEAVRDARIDNVEIVLLSDQSVKVSVQGPMFFELGEARLRPEVREFLDRLARVIGQTSFAVQVIGHTDDYPVVTEAFPSNWELSAARAARVARYLINSAGIDPRRFTVMGRGEHEPAVANTNDANRALNRRVEIIITRDEIEPSVRPAVKPPVSEPPMLDSMSMLQSLDPVTVVTGLLMPRADMPDQAAPGMPIPIRGLSPARDAGVVNDGPMPVVDRSSEAVGDAPDANLLIAPEALTADRPSNSASELPPPEAPAAELPSTETRR